jgi:hypothetical protein
MGSHALLSPSSAARWTACPPSARLCEHVAEGPSVFAEEGTEAHTLCEHKVKLALGLASVDPVPTLRYHSEEMDSCADEYAAFVLEALQREKESGRDPIVLTEQRLDISAFVPECSGTGDCVIVSDGRLHVIDFKYGQGVPVSAERNKQMMLYALGALGMFGSLYEVDEVSMTVFQPRLANVGTSTMGVDELLGWAESYLKPRAELAFQGGGEFSSGPHCRFCKVKATCRARAEANLELARYEFAKPVLLGEDEIAAILTQADELEAWVGDIRAHAFSVVAGGGVLEGFKLVEGRSVRRYTDEDSVAEAVATAGYDPYEQKVRGITAMTELLGRTRFNEILGLYVCRPKGKLTLVPVGDKRPAITIDDFEDIKEK